MGEVTELVLDGVLCHRCGSFVSEIVVGHPRLCEDCDDTESDID